MTCVGCTDELVLVSFGWVPIDGGTGHPTSIEDMWPRYRSFIPGPGPDAIGLGAWDGLITELPLMTFIQLDSSTSIGGQNINPYLDGTTSAAYHVAKINALAPHITDDPDTSKAGKCNYSGIPPRCIEQDPCTGSAKVQFEITDGMFDQATYATACTNGQEDVGGSPADPAGGVTPHDSDAQPADPNGQPNPQTSPGHPEDPNNPGTPDLTKVALEISYGNCGCTRIMLISFKDGNGNKIRVKDPATGQIYSLVIGLKAECSSCKVIPPPLQNGVCCYEVDHEPCCIEGIEDEEDCEGLTPQGGEFINWVEDGDCEACDGIEVEPCEELN